MQTAMNRSSTVARPRLQAGSHGSSIGALAVGHPLQARRSGRTPSSRVHASAGQGFGEKQQRQRAKEDEAAAAGASTSGATATSTADVDVDAALARRRNRRRVEAQVKVESASVAQATGATPQTQLGEVETTAVRALGIFFAVLLTEGLVLAASGFLPEEWDALVRDYLYPSFSPQMLAFLGASSVYGLWKTGKLPGQKQL